MERLGMRLTPIPQKRARGAGGSSRRSRHTAEKTLEGSRVKRQKTSPTRHESEPNLAAGEPAKALRLRTRRQKTSILDLPDWLLIDIFMLEKNFGFPRCCNWIGRALSHPYVFRRLIADAFSPTWDLWFGCAAQDVSSYQSLPDSECFTWICDSDRLGGDPKLQDDILARKWLTLDRILQAQQIWLDTKRKWGPTYYRVPLALGLKTKQHHGNRSFGFEGFLEGSEFTVRKQFELEYNVVVTDMAVDAFRPLLYPNMLEVHPATRFPDRLIVGPWAEDDVKLLFWLGRAGAVMSPNQSWEIVLEGLDCMVSIAREHSLESARIDQVRNLLSRVVRLFEMFKIWAKVPFNIFMDYSKDNDLGWLGEILVLRTRIGEVLATRRDC